MSLRVAALRRLIAPLRTGPDARSQNAVARALGLEPSTLSRWLGGHHASYPQVAQIAAQLGVPAEDLWDGPVPRRLEHPKARRVATEVVTARERITAGELAGALRTIAAMRAELDRLEADFRRMRRAR